jgi:diketogulonate reductase-like aldo/keto reductase
MSIKLNNGFDMPALGFGTFLIKDADAFYRALKNGYTHFDTATIYANE